MTTQSYPMLSDPTFLLVVAILGIWSLIWKGFALWRSAQDQSKVWFVVLLIVHTLGVLEIVYIFVISPMRKKLTAKS